MSELPQIDFGNILDAPEVQQIRALTLLKQLKVAQRLNGIAFYRPTPKQAKFHAAAGYRYRYVRTGNRFGKSVMGAAEDIAWLLGERPWLPAGTEERTIGIPSHPVKGVLICSDWDKSEEIFTARTTDVKTCGKLFALLPKEKTVKVTTNHSGKIFKIDVQGLYGVSTLYIDTVQSFKSAPMGHESSDWDFVHVDEPCPREMWVAYARGLVDRGGSAWFNCTPLTEAWINDYFLPSARHEVEGDMPYIEGQKWVMTGSSFDNTYLKKEFIDEYAEGLTEDEKQCRIYGIPTALAGCIYKVFSPDRHIYRETPKGWKRISDPPAEYSVRYAVDCHPRTPTAVLFAATAPNGHVFFWDEFFETGVVSEWAQKILQRTEGRNVIYGMMDPLGFITHPVLGTTMADEFMRCGVALEEAPKDPSNGIIQVTEWLKGEDSFGVPLFHFAPHLRQTLFEFDHYMWDDKVPDKPKAKDNHMMENLYRLVLTGLDYIDPSENDGLIVPYSSMSDSVFRRQETSTKRTRFAGRYR